MSDLNFKDIHHVPFAVETRSDAELLALLIGGKGAEKKAAALLEEIGGLGQLRREVGASSLPEAARERILAALEVARRGAEAAIPVHTLPHGDAAGRLARMMLGHLNHEELWAFCLDGCHRMIRRVKLAEGGASGAAVSIPKALATILRSGAAGFVLAHNHPSGNPTPSSEDITMTRQLKHAAEVVGLQLLDHVIVTSSAGYVSMFERGLM